MGRLAASLSISGEDGLVDERKLVLNLTSLPAVDESEVVPAISTEHLVWGYSSFK